MLAVRPPAVAGAFYSSQTTALSCDVTSLLARAQQQARASDRLLPTPKALIVPHAGYIYSGSTAARAYARLTAGRHSIHRVVLLGPVHRVQVRGLALPGVDAFETPLGPVMLDQAAMAQIATLPQVTVSQAAHAQEHALEVQLPFLQSVLDDFTLVPLAVGEATPTEVADVLAHLWGGPETLVVVSSDLSHYLPYRAAQERDANTVQTILDMGSSLTHQQACGSVCINGLMLVARQHHLQPALLGMCNSGDTAGDKTRVVGYAALALTEGGHDGHGSH